MTKPPIRGGLYAKKLTPYTIFLRHTNQKKIAAQVLKRIAKKQIDSLDAENTGVWRYADIGCGSGEISAMLLSDLSTEYTNLTIQGIFLEPSELLLSRTEDALRQIPRLQQHLVNKPIEEAQLVDLAPWGRNNLLVCIQVLYYVKDWFAQVQKMLGSLRRNGNACFVLREASSQTLEISDRFLNSINRLAERSIVAKEVEDGLNRLGIHFESEIINSSVIFPLSDALEMPLSPDAYKEVGRNIAFDLTRFFTRAEYWHLASPEILKEIKSRFNELQVSSAGE